VVTRGKVHDYLGMVIDFSKSGKVQIKMVDYITDMLDELRRACAAERRKFGDVPSSHGQTVVPVQKSLT
jgi:hypothetical protein